MNLAAFEESGEGVRLSPQQRRLWELERAGAPNTVSLRLRWETGIELPRLRSAFEAVVARHEGLRTVFPTDARLRYPLQLALQRLPHGWRERSAEDRDAARTTDQPKGGARALPNVRQNWDFERGPLVAVELACREGSPVEGLLSASSLVVDAESLLLIVDEWRAEYERRPRVEEDPVQYSAFSEYQHELWEEGEYQRAKLSAAARLPFEAEEGSGAEARLELFLDEELRARLIEGARRLRVGLDVFVLGAWQAQIQRLIGRGEACLLLELPGREGEDERSVVGPLVSWAPLRARREPRGPFEDWIGAVRRAVELVRGGDERVESGLEAARWSEQVGYRFLSSVSRANVAGGDAELRSSWVVEEFDPPGAGLKCLLTVVEAKAGLRLRLDYDTGRFSRRGAELLLEQLVGILEEVLANPRVPLEELTLETRSESAEGPVVSTSFDELAPLHSTFERWAKVRAAEPAVRAGDESLDYAELDRRANRLAQHLLERGLGRNPLVAICCDRSVHAAVGIVGVWKAGGAYVPLDPHAPAERLRAQLEQVDFVVTEERVRAALPSFPQGTISLDEPGALDAGLDTAPRVSVLLDELASVVFTSGSTGVPKGVAVTHRGVASYVESVRRRFAVEPGWSFASVTTLSADLGNTSVFLALATGGCLHLVDFATATDGRSFWGYVREWGVDVLKIVPSHLNALLEVDEELVELPRRLLVLGGEAFPTALAARLEACSPSCLITNHYGPTETTVGTLVAPLPEILDRKGCESIPVGRSLANGAALVLDERGAPVGVGVVGELFVGGEGLARGYLSHPALTAERFVPHPSEPGARLYRTGDRVRRRPDGTIEFLGRKDHQLKIRGFRVELGEIEARLRQKLGVIQVAVLPFEEAGSVQLVAYVAVDDSFVGLDEVRSQLRRELPDYMIPSEILVSRSLPLTPNGKLDRAALPAPTRERSKDFVAPRTPAEIAIAAIWRELLGLERVSVDDDFFALGGHSLLAIPLVHRVQKALGGELSLSAIFQAPTVAGLARLFEGVEKSQRVVLRPGTTQSPLFCFDPTGYHVELYRPLAESLPEDQPVIGIELGAAELDGAGLRPVIERLLSEVRRAAPRGPYRLLGWSLGGVLAFGVAQELERAGETVEFLGVVDADPRAGLYDAGEPDVFEELAAYAGPEWAAGLRSLSEHEAAAWREEWSLLEGDERVDAVIRWAQERGVLASDARPEAFRLRYRLLRAAAHYVAGLEKDALRAPLHAWWSEETLARSQGDAPLSWGRYSSGRLVTARLTGDHLEAVSGEEIRGQVRAIFLTLASGPQRP